MYSIPEAELPEDHKPPHSLMPLTSSNGGAPRWFKFLWECHWSPFSLVRYTGPLGAKFVSGWSSRRFANLPRSEADALHRYSYGIFNSPGSGEYALNYLLAPGANGRWPLAERAHRINCPSVWVYGDRDWMDIRGGYQAAASIRQAGGYAEVVTVPNSGHHIYLDNPSMLNWHITNFMNRSY
jgi:cardiolipin-specific phospholipase